MVMTPPGSGNDQVSQMMQMAMMYQKDPEGLVKIMAATGQPPPPLPSVQINQLANITPKPGSQIQPQITQPQPQAPQAPQMNVIPQTPPVVTGQDIRASQAPLGPANVAPGGGYNIGGLMEALGALQTPQQPQLHRPEFAPAMSLNRTGAQVDPAILQRLIAMMSGAQNVRPQPGVGSGLGSLISGR